jgi:hypothetical protein
MASTLGAGIDDEGQAAAGQLLQWLAGAGAAEDRAVAGAGHVDVAVAGKIREDGGDEAAGRQVVGEAGVDAVEHVGGRTAGLGEGADERADLRDDHRRGHAVAGGVGDEHGEAAVFERPQVVAVAAGDARGDAPAGDVEVL